MRVDQRRFFAAVTAYRRARPVGSVLAAGTQKRHCARKSGRNASRPPLHGDYRLVHLLLPTRRAAAVALAAFIALPTTLCAQATTPAAAVPAGTRALFAGGQLSGGAPRERRARRHVGLGLLPRGAARRSEEPGAAGARLPLRPDRRRRRRRRQARRARHRSSTRPTASPGWCSACARSSRSNIRRRASTSRSRCAGRSPI